MGFGGISLWQILIIAVYIAVVVTPFWKIYGKAGFSRWLAVMMLVPILNFIILYYVAFAHWPALADRQRA